MGTVRFDIAIYNFFFINYHKFSAGTAAIEREFSRADTIIT